MSKSKMVWIDDNPGRATTADDLGAEFINVKGKGLAIEVQKLLAGRAPSLLIIDHVLDKAADTHPLFQKGSTIAEAIKEKWPSCPVIGVTNANTITDIDVRTKSTYDALFPFHNFGMYLDRINGIARGFTQASRAGSDVDELLALLKAPSNELPRLREALSDDLKTRTQDASVASRLHRWIDRLLGRPGFLYDDLWTATFLGLTEDGFNKVRSAFDKAKYSGIFTRPNEPRWWASKVSEILYKVAPPAAGELSWQAGRRLPKVRHEHFSSCHYCKEEFPEIVAFLDEASDERRAMHLKCTILHPRFTRELYFEDIRMMRGND